MSRYVRTSSYQANYGRPGHEIASAAEALDYALAPNDSAEPYAETRNLTAALVLLLIERGVIDDGADMERLLNATDGATYEVVR